MYNESIDLLIKQSRSYVILAHLLHSEYYLRRARQTLSLARSLVQELNKDKTIEYRLVG